MSTDMAHNLGDIFERKLEKEVVNVLLNLDVYEIDPEYVMCNDFAFIMEYLGKLLSGTEGKRERFMQVENGYQLEVFLPYANKEDIDLYQSATDLIIKTGNFKRSIPLPNIFRSYMVSEAKFEEGKLRIYFKKE